MHTDSRKATTVLYIKRNRLSVGSSQSSQQHLVLHLGQPAERAGEHCREKPDDSRALAICRTADEHIITESQLHICSRG